MRKIGEKERWDYKHPDKSYKQAFEMPSGNMLAGVSFLIKNIIVRAIDLFGKNGSNQDMRRMHLEGHATQINSRLIELYNIDEYNYGKFEAGLAQKLIGIAQQTDLEYFNPVFINFNFKMTSLKFFRTKGEKVSLEWWGYLGNQ